MNVQPATNHLQLELHVPDFEPVKAYYGKLGFKVVWERTPEAEKGYLVIKRDDVTLCFWCGTDDVYGQPYFQKFPKDTVRGYGVEIVIMVDDVDALYNGLEDDANVVEPLITQPWGLKDFRAVDPFGYYLRFTSRHDILDNANAVE
jgi:lactoylglutathione lyase